MTVKDFIIDFKSNADMEKHIKTNYISYGKKIGECELIVKYSCYETINNKEIFKINTPLRKALFLLKMVDLYTDIDIDWKNPLNDLDELSQSNILDTIIAYIPKKEFQLFSTMLDMIIDDIMVNTREIVPFLENKLDAIEMVSNSVLEILQSDSVQKIITGMIDTVEK